MASAINTNIMSLNAQRNLNTSQTSLSTSLQRLSSGLRINSASDDAAGLSISTGLTSQINGLNQATRNANDGVSLAQTADGALSQISSILQRMSQLAVQASTATVGTSQRTTINAEVSQLKTQIGQIASKTNFNGVNLLSGSNTSGFTLQIGANQGDTLKLTISGATLSILGLSALTVSGTSVSNAASAIKAIKSALDKINSNRANLGASINRLGYVVSLNQITSNNLSAANSQIQDTDYAAETANLTKNNILQQAGTSILAQANSLPQNVLSLLR